MQIPYPTLPDDDESASSERLPASTTPPSTARRWSAIPPRASARRATRASQEDVHTEELPCAGDDTRLPFWNQRHLRYLFTGGMTALLLIILCLWGSDRFQELEMQWHYGDARITQMDADVGHGGRSHFLAFCAKGSVVIIEFSHKSDPTQEHTYVLQMFSEGSTTIPRTVTLEVQTIDGKRDVLVHVEGMQVAALLVNTGDAFRTDQY